MNTRRTRAKTNTDIYTGETQEEKEKEKEKVRINLKTHVL